MDPAVSAPAAFPAGRAEGESLLVVDDEESIRAVIRERLSLAGFRVAEASNGRDALSLLESDRFSILLTDIRMPGMDGLSLLREAARAAPDTAGVVMTAHAEVDTAVAALKLGAYDFLLKPFHFEALLHTIRNVLGKKAMERQLRDYQQNLEWKVSRQTEQINSMYVRSIDSLINALEAKDFHSRGHSQRVTLYSVALGERAGLRGERLAELRRAAILHDLGKIGVRETILNKPSRLSEQEFGEIVRHPEVAIQILSPIPYFRPILPAILHHHEWYDGTGYPARIGGEKIPGESRILAVADAFDAMTSDRAYRAALTAEQAIAEIRRFAGRQFDPELVPFLPDLPRVQAAVRSAPGDSFAHPAEDRLP